MANRFEVRGYQHSDAQGWYQELGFNEYALEYTSAPTKQEAIAQLRALAESVKREIDAAIAAAEREAEQ